MPVSQGDGRYWLGSPQFDKAVIRLDRDYYEGETFTVIARNNSQQNVYVQGVRLNGTALSRPWILHEEIVAGGVLEFEMGPEPSTALWADSRE